MECNSHSTSILDGRSWTSHPQQCHWKCLHSFLLQQLSTAAMKPAWRNNIWSLHDHLKWHFWMRACTGRWRLWEWKQELKYNHSSQKEHHRYTMFSQVRICLSTLPHLLPQLNNTQNTPLEDSEATTHHCLVFTSSDDESPVRINDPHSWHHSPL